MYGRTGPGSQAAVQARRFRAPQQPRIGGDPGVLKSWKQTAKPVLCLAGRNHCKERLGAGASAVQRRQTPSTLCGTTHLLTSQHDVDKHMQQRKEAGSQARQFGWVPSPTAKPSSTAFMRHSVPANVPSQVAAAHARQPHFCVAAPSEGSQAATSRQTASNRPWERLARGNCCYLACARSQPLHPACCQPPGFTVHQQPAPGVAKPSCRHHNRHR